MAAANSAGIVGKPMDRVDAPLKVSGQAMYSADVNFPGMLYAVPVPATIAAGTIAGIDTARAEKMPGVRAVYTRATIGQFYRVAPNNDFSAVIDERRPPMDDDTIRYYGQYVALAVADTLEQAQAAARAVRVTYNRTAHDVGTVLSSKDKPGVDSERGDPAAGYAQGAVKLDLTYATPAEVHNPIEAHATVAVWAGDKVTLYDTVQAVVNHRAVMSQMLGVPKDNVRVVTRFLGSGFGGKLWPWTHCLLSAQAARKLGKPVKLVIDRKSMFSAVGHRPHTSQRIRIAAGADGKLTSLQHDYLNATSILDDYKENCGEATGFLYSTPNMRITSALSRKNIGTPTSMRGPGAVPGLFALESAMDELAIALKVDPIDLRLRNEPAIDESVGVPFSSRHLKECLTEGGKRFGWSRRTPGVGSMTRDGMTIGWGVAAATWIAARFDCDAGVELRADGTVRVTCAAQDIGTGTYTMFAQIAGEATGVAAEKVEVVIGDTALPPGPMSGGSMLTASIIPPVHSAVEAAGKRLIDVAIAPGGPFAKRKAEDLVFERGMVKPKAGGAGVPFAQILSRGRVKAVSGEGQAKGTFAEALGITKPKLSSHSFIAQFAEVTWQPEIARLRVSRTLSVVDAGRMINPKTARNQIAGAVVMGVGMALFEHMSFDERSGAPINANLADYVMTTHADAPDMDVLFLDYPDYNLNALGAKGVGEIGLAGMAAAITNAIHHATGKRIRELPAKIEDLI
jgi:xanthine dehydrogenase YagR molybdenum-binding subunit